ncbi:MAG TPA: transcription termination factor Rho [Myxococcales bacterium]|jgi:transcription termination factor Rho
MNGEGQRPPAPEAKAHNEAPEPGNARYPQEGARGGNGGGGGNNGGGGNAANGNAANGNTFAAGQNAQNGQQPQGEGRRRFRRNRRGGRGRRGKGGGQGGPNQTPAPLDAQGRIVDVENDAADDGGDEGDDQQPGQSTQPAQAKAAVEGEPQPPAAAPEGNPTPEAQAAAPAAEGTAPAPQQQRPQQQNHQRHQNQQRHQQQPRQEQLTACEGVLDVDHRGNGKLRIAKYNFLPQQDDVEVPRHLIDRDRLRPGVLLTGQAARRNGRPQLVRTDTVEGLPPQDAAKRTAFQNLTVIDPDDRLVMETTPKELLTRVIDIVSPIGLGQRMLIVAPPKTGKTIMLQKICAAITVNRPDVIQMVLLVDERPEEVTDFRRTVKADVYASSSDRPTDEHLHVAEMALERAKRLVEAGKDVVMLLDSITRLSRAYNKEVESSGRTLSGGVDSRALERPKRLFGAARNAEEGGSLTIIATALIDTGSRMDEVIFEEFKGTGNSEINLDRQLAEKRIFPAINIQTSGTRKEEKLFSQHEYEKVKKLRGALFALKPVEAMERLLKSIAEYNSNAEFLDEV